MVQERVTDASEHVQSQGILPDRILHLAHPGEGLAPAVRVVPSGGIGGDAIVALSLIHISEPTRLLSISYAVFCLKKKKKNKETNSTYSQKIDNEQYIVLHIENVLT
eukprot:TRINITY_DN6557_c0_g1_i4.p1 TRINITY_DN6557_c0_g1~~TRINITY_DN6557_c0_g1_i4.p1  ORF type:complete len:107 (+),score=11.60 TRINITY_DN6557_c0_g1_i4:690-1010(+)